LRFRPRQPYLNKNTNNTEAAFLAAFLFDRGNHFGDSTVYILKTPCMKKQLFIALMSLMVIIGCTKSSEKASTNNNNGNISCTGTKSYASDVSPIIQSVCANAGCHDASSTNGVGPLTTYQQVFNARTSIRSAVASGLMPKNTTLSDAQKSAIICWIDNGATNN
jgi:hypothetical protein